MGAPSFDAEPTLRGYAPGQRVFGRYVLRRILGRGGMGVVWQARDDTLGEEIALKVLPDAVRWDEGALGDLKAETRRARQLTHPNIIRVHDFVDDASGAAISMELVDGRTLTALRAERPGHVLDPEDIRRWLPDLCAALDYAHRDARVVHRDLKPTNIMLAEAGVIKVADFGIARSLVDSITRVSMMSAGTLVYMSPQQAMGEEPSPADDIYALGATLYELLAGKPPFHTGDVRLQLFHRKPENISARRAALGLANAALPQHWEETIAACLAKEPAQRPATAGEVAARLVAHESIAPSGGKSGRRRRGYRLGLAVAVALAVVAVGWAGRRWWRKPGAAEVGQGHPSDAWRALAAWNFDGNGRDSSGHGLHGLATGTVPTQDRHGRIDRALRFNGNAGIVVADAPALRWSGADHFTAAMWVRPGREDLNIEFCRSSPQAVGALFWAIGIKTGVPDVQLGRLENDQLTRVFGATALKPGIWHHYAVTSDGETLTLFVDGTAAGRGRLGENRTARRPDRVELRFGRPQRLATAAFFGDLDDALIWRRVLSSEEIADLAGREPPPEFVVSKGVYGDKDDLPAAVRAEFGADARLADWEDLRRWHRDDAAGWVEELGLGVGTTGMWIQRQGERRHQPQRHYFVTRFDGVKPDYFLSHEELGGMTLSLGSWYGTGVPAFVLLPWRAPRTKILQPDATGMCRERWDFPGRAKSLQLVWRSQISLRQSDSAAVTMTTRQNRVLRVACVPAKDTFALTLGDTPQPQRMRQVAASYGEIEFTLVARDGSLRFRAISGTGATPVFDESVSVEELRLDDLAMIEVVAPDWREVQPRLAGATLIVE